MKQMALDIGLSTRPSLQTFFAGPNEAALNHLHLWTTGGTRAPVPTYLWGETGSGKTHLLQAVHQALTEQGLAVGWLDSHTSMPWPDEVKAKLESLMTPDIPERRPVSAPHPQA